ncbi:N-alpha-acetyltransferase 35, NatC auxiliary subunit isoform X2 [Amborella trichopoda]|uniref:N-alpha-acetyltransferase 35, NatC auxiliary subunit isoform X2 n=1 Tax=Amborella trichopoda TaxID=13333 RepID=UPI0009C0AAF7|nr:N-alpha-acetyltransferase 35, NatC auxiliary subunit isoform X2 [Amborella trichopoda]|eukprot:XP_020530591.1 N-alpha-acetyltransferase 35, NatC auxiliary subunit isoform X2 [Amborella trichopoda]
MSRGGRNQIERSSRYARFERGMESNGIPPSPISSGEQSVWVDVSPLLEAAGNELKEGELIHGENFSLFAAMSALEIMDPKMDAGMEKFGYRSVEEAIENGAAPIPFSTDKTTDIQCIIDVMDHLLSCEAAWHKGYPLAQTVFSCIYLLRLERTSSHALLHSYCRMIRTTCNSVLSVVSDARTHEEEDLFIMAFGLPLKGEGDKKCLSMLSAVEETIARQLRACKNPTKKKVLDMEPLQSNPDLEEGYCKALLSRIRFRKYYYHVLMCMRKAQGRGLELARKHIASCLAELASIYGSSEFLMANAHGIRQAVIEDRTTASGCQPIGFHTGLDNVAPTPPRAIKIISWKKALEYFEKLLQDLDIICSFRLDPLLEDVLQFVVQFQKSQPDLVARAHLQLLLVQDGKLYGRDPLSDVISRAALSQVIKDQSFQKNEFIIQLGQLVINLLKILCTNAAWQRRKLGKILQDWGATAAQLQLSSKREVDNVLNIRVEEEESMKLSKHLLCWTEEQTYWIAGRFLMLGFELELYSPSEYCMVYWYLYIVMFKLLEKAQLRIVQTNDSSKKKGKKKRDPLKDGAKEIQYPSHILLLQCYINLSEGLAMMLAALSNENSNFEKPSIFNTEQERFIQHFELLQKAHVPEGVSYIMFKDLMNHVNFSTIMRYNYFGAAQLIARDLKGRFSGDPEKMSELRRVEQVAEHNKIALNVICQAGIKDPSLKVSFEFTHHACFAIAVVKRS